MRTLLIVCLLALVAASTPCATAEEKPAPKPIAPPVEPPNDNPRKAEAPLPAKAGWHAALVMDNKGVGVWTVKSFQVFDHLACPEVVGLDDNGRCHVLMSYSGTWAPISVLHDGSWLGGLTHADVDPRVRGAELYTGSQRGNIYQVRAYEQTLLDGRRIATLPGREIHTVVAGDLDPRSPGSELIVFTRPGAVYRVSPTGEHGGFEVTKLQDLRGRVRDAVVLPARKGETPRIALVSRTGALRLLKITAQGLQWTTVHGTNMGKGRVALKPARPGQPLVLYTTHDDGRIMRHQELENGWGHETIYLGPLGPRGVVAGRFDADYAVETVAIFGYSKRVELLTKTDKGWKAETIFEGLAKGHWLCAGEVDGRNATQELFASGFGGHIVQLMRPPGYGRMETAAKR
ncbi:MAG: hypothetical protein QNJ90_10680 [Planctomycetota bacterium]|nr:hypothetical protein [Planctomycetota bacterium]